MAASPKKPKSSEPKGTQRSQVQQIDELKLPKRSFNRRSIYMGENVFCWLKTNEGTVRTEVIDLSSRGTAVIKQKKPVINLRKGMVVTAEFNHNNPMRFEVKGKITNITNVRYGGKDHQRIGIHFAMHTCADIEEFAANIKLPTFPAKSYIRPQVSCVDPFFFNEVILFQLLSFTKEGMVLVVSARNKTILPHQPLELEVYLPGHGLFYVPSRCSDLFCETSENRYRIYVTYEAPLKEFLDAISEYLVMFSGGLTPKRLRKAGFTMGNMAGAIAIHYPNNSTIEEPKLRSSVISPPARGARTSKPDFTRVVRCKLGPLVAAQLGLLFVEGDSARSRFVQDGHKVKDPVIKGRHVELIDFFAHDEASLVDFLIPLLTHVVRIAFQAQMRFLVIEASAPILAVLRKLGFRDMDSRVRKGNQGTLWHLMVLDVSKAISNEGAFLPGKLWTKVYRDLSKYLRRQAT